VWPTKRVKTELLAEASFTVSLRGPLHLKGAPYTLKDPIHPKLNYDLQLCNTITRKTGLAQHSFPISFVRFFVSSVCLLVRVTVVDKDRAVVCCLLATSAIMLSEKKKRKREMCSKKWYLKRNIS